MADSCATCFFGRTAPADDPFVGSLLCGRNAPTYQQGAGPLWPVVSPDFWCGEFSDIDPHVYGIIGPPGPAGPPGSAGPAGAPGFNPVTVNTVIPVLGTLTSAAPHMLGLNTVMTPTTTGRLLVFISGFELQVGGGTGGNWQIYVGTGTAPANGGTLTGTGYGSVQEVLTSGTGLDEVPFSIPAIVTGLALNTQVWIDLAVASLANGVSFRKVNVIGIEF